MAGPIIVTIFLVLNPIQTNCGRTKRKAEIIEIAHDLARTNQIQKNFDPIFGVPLANTAPTYNDAPRDSALLKETKTRENTERSHRNNKQTTREDRRTWKNEQKYKNKGHEKFRVSEIKDIKEYILSNQKILNEIARNSSLHNAEPVIRCKKFCRHRSTCCKIIYKIQRAELSLMSRALSSEYVPAISKGLTIAGTVGLALMGLKYFKYRDGKSSFLSETYQYHFDKDKKMIIQANDTLWVEKLKNFIANDSELKDVDSFFCCLSTQPFGEMECFPQKRKKSKTRYRSQFNKIDITCKSGLSYNIAVNLDKEKYENVKY